MYLMLDFIYRVQGQPKKHVLLIDHTDLPAPTGKMS